VQTWIRCNSFHLRRNAPTKIKLIQESSDFVSSQSTAHIDAKITEIDD